ARGESGADVELDELAGHVLAVDRGELGLKCVERDGADELREEDRRVNGEPASYPRGGGDLGRRCWAREGGLRGKGGTEGEECCDFHTSGRLQAGCHEVRQGFHEG